MSSKGPSVPQPDERQVVFRFRPDRKVAFAELRGDMVHWFHGTALSPATGGDGALEAALRLPPGTYAYKFRTSDGQWHLDGDNGRTRGEDGVRNSLLVVGGAEEPVLHAPARPYVFVTDDGRLCVRAGLRRGGEGDRLTLRWFESERRDVPMRLCGSEDEHLLFQAYLPASQRAVEYLFVLPSGRCVGAAGGAGQAFRVVPRVLRPDTPAWWRDAVLYTVFLDRFRRGRGQPWLHAGERAPAGGDLWGVIEGLPHLRDLGVSVLHLTPVAPAQSAHRYDAIDPRKVDPQLGGEEALRALLDEAHRLGLRVILDLAVTHVHRDFFAFRDVRERGHDSPYAPWFHIRRFPFIEGPSPGYDHYQKGQWQEPLLRLSCEEVAEYLEETFVLHARLGVDGFRVDAAAEVPLSLMRRIRRAVRAVRPDIVLFGEVIPGNIHRFTGDALDAATDFPLQQALYEWLWHRRANAGRTAEVLGRRAFWRGGPGWTAIGFTATHDQHRFLSLVRDTRVALLAHLLLLTRPEVPAIYYGDEFALSCDEPQRDFEDAWPDRQPLPWDTGPRDERVLSLIRQAIALRRESQALRRGDEEPLGAGGDGQVLAFRRSFGEEVVEVYLHGAEGTAIVPLAEGAPGAARVLLQLGDVVLDAGRGMILLGPFSGMVLRREAAAEARALWQEVVPRNRALCAESYRQGQLMSLTLPANLYLTVTEACNLRCRHCITEAPQRTKEGRARSVQPWLIEALSEAFAAADYFGFAHGGESLVSPIFPEVLRAIRRARAGRPYDVHLLSNGMLLTGETTRELIDLGVTSLAVSLDGASAATNDAIRLLGRFDRIVAHVREAVAARRQLGADLRIGISTVIARSNVAEMAQLGQLTVDLGVDWIKVEEMFPVNGFSRLERIDPQKDRVTEGLSALRRIVEPHGIVVVDHLHPPRGCRCQAPQVPGLLAFRDADDFANRACFRPCRMAWEQACIDPDGTVHPIDYFHPALGNLLETPFLDLWNGELMRRLRADALRRIDGGLRRKCR